MTRPLSRPAADLVPPSRSAANPFAKPDLWQAFRFVGYFQRETVAVFANSMDACDFCLANIGGEHGNGYFVGEYTRAA